MECFFPEIRTKPPFPSKLLKIFFSTMAFFESLHKIPFFTSLYPYILDDNHQHELFFVNYLLFSLGYKLHVSRNSLWGEGVVIDLVLLTMFVKVILIYERKGAESDKPSLMLLR